MGSKIRLRYLKKHYKGSSPLLREEIAVHHSILHFLSNLTDNLYFLGLLKLYGITISKDVIGAAQAFEKAAQLGNPDAQTAIGVMKMKAIG
jgi:TPR repeat protein